LNFNLQVLFHFCVILFPFCLVELLYFRCYLIVLHCKGPPILVLISLSVDGFLPILGLRFLHLFVVLLDRTFFCFLFVF
jgi:hypothetical protein